MSIVHRANYLQLCWTLAILGTIWADGYLPAHTLSSVSKSRSRESLCRPCILDCYFIPNWTRNAPKVRRVFYHSDTLQILIVWIKSMKIKTSVYVLRTRVAQPRCELREIESNTEETSLKNGTSDNEQPKWNDTFNPVMKLFLSHISSDLHELMKCDSTRIHDTLPEREIDRFNGNF